MSLQTFLSVRDGLSAPAWWLARALSVPTEISWHNHNNAILTLRDHAPSSDAHPDFSLLDLKIALATKTLDDCDLCPHLCHVNRNAGKVGFCGVAHESAVHWEGVLYGEEIELVPSHEVFLSGCTMRCAFCYSHEHIVKPMSGRRTSPTDLAACASNRKRQGATNLNLVGGEPTVHLPNILRALRELNEPLPLVWNSNLYAMPHAMQLLEGVVDLYLGDIHFGNDECARTLGRIPSYVASVTKAFEMAVASRASVVIRHLVMPGHLDCCALPAMQWAKAVLPDVPFHLMYQYVPDYRAEGDLILGRPLSRAEIARVRQMAQNVGIRLYKNGARPSTADHAERPGEKVLEMEPWAGNAIDILIHDDGRVSFTRLSEELLPVLKSLGQPAS
jgi:putative pyruvate formate lyase activating enzyme